MDIKNIAVRAVKVTERLPAKLMSMPVLLDNRLPMVVMYVGFSPDDEWRYLGTQKPLKAGIVTHWFDYSHQPDLVPYKLISEADAQEVARIASNWDRAAPLDADDVSEWLEEIFTGNCALTADYVSGHQILEITEFLQSRFYDVHKKQSL